MYVTQRLKHHELMSLKGGRPLEAFVLLHESSALNLKYGLPGVSGDVLLLKSSLFGDLGMTESSLAYT